jgi:hypothetical protein
MTDKLFKLESDPSYGDRIEVAIYGGSVTIRVENDWAGDTETGFGQSTSISLHAQDARKLAHWLLEQAADEQNKT